MGSLRSDVHLKLVTRRKDGSKYGDHKNIVISINSGSGRVNKNQLGTQKSSEPHSSPKDSKITL